MKPRTWHLWLDEVPRPGWANMSIDTALLDRAELEGENWLRLYQWEPHCLSFGRHEPALQAYDVERIRKLGLDTVRRPTGGRAVWHACELTYAVAASVLAFGSLRRAYLEIHRLLSDALGSMGIETSLAPRVRSVPLDAGACFSQPVGGEVLVRGRKLIGSAQLRRGDALLQHGSILLHNDQSLVTSLTRSGVEGAATKMDWVMDQQLPPGHVARQIATCAASRWLGPWEPVTNNGPVLQLASRHYPQFQSSAWTWAR